MVYAFFECGRMRTTLRDFPLETREHERTVREWFREASLPSPHTWLSVGSATCAALRLQRLPEAPLLDVAVLGGYNDHSALSRQMNRLFWVRPLEIRERLGWEWVLHRWLRREGLPALPAPAS